ncbi:hypothetical protein BFJ72_g7318 [Fusarium proliferatum]|uniref:Uncharacterized protein n=1 Tax=Gibberella intermedia TaxID=948311 RepID=A0A420TAG5_GIBIN|nr:hypothetical protein BFJ72_g7318 [Fusarium proliferatum]
MGTETNWHTIKPATPHLSYGSYGTDNLSHLRTGITV